MEVLTPQEVAPQPAAWEKYLPVIRTMLHRIAPDEARERAGIMLMRDMAGKKRAVSSWAADAPLGAVRAIADECALSALSLTELKAVRKALIRMTMAARDLDGVFDGRFDG